MTVQDLTPKMNIPSAETELSLPFGITDMVQSTGGAATTANAIKRGYGNNIFGQDDNGIWLGAQDYADAPFRVNMQGDIYASSALFPNLITITIFKQTSIPTSLAIGDLWFDTDDGNKLYRAASVGADAITAGEWEAVAPVTITVFAQDAIPTSLAAGDLWYDTNDSNKVYRAFQAGATTISGSGWVLVADERAADAILKSNSGQTLSGNIQVGASNVKIDGANKRIIINDGSDDIILIGFQSGGF